MKCEMKSSVSFFKIKTIIFWSLNRSMGNFHPCCTHIIIILNVCSFIHSFAAQVLNRMFFIFEKGDSDCHCQWSHRGQWSEAPQYSLCCTQNSLDFLFIMTSFVSFDLVIEKEKQKKKIDSMSDYFIVRCAVRTHSHKQARAFDIVCWE